MASLLDHFRSLMGGGQAFPVHPSHGITPAQQAYMSANHYSPQGQPTYEILGPQTPEPSKADWNMAPPAAANQPDLPYRQAVGKMASPRTALPYAQYRSMMTGPHLGLAGANPYSQVPLDGSAVFRGDPLNDPRALGLPRMSPQQTGTPAPRTVSPQTRVSNPAYYGQSEESAAADPQSQVASPMNLVIGPGPKQPRISLH